MRFFLQHWDSSWDTLKALLDRNADDLAVLAPRSAQRAPPPSKDRRAPVEVASEARQALRGAAAAEHAERQAVSRRRRQRTRRPPEGG